jgi:hypothetical protein
VTLRIWLFVGFAFFVVAVVARVALVTIRRGANDGGDKVALAVITGLLSLISGGVGAIIAGTTAQEGAKEAGSAAVKAGSSANTAAAKEAAKEAAEHVSSQVSTAVQKATEPPTTVGKK